MEDALLILVAIDFDEISDEALTQALRLARRAHGRLLLAHVAPASVFARDTLAANAEARLRADELDERLARLCDEARSNGVPAEARVLHGPTVAALLGEIDVRRPDLVVVGSHRRGGVGRLLLGSISDAICRRSPVPVVVVGDPTREIAGAEPDLL